MGLGVQDLYLRELGVGQDRERLHSCEEDGVVSVRVWGSGFWFWGLEIGVMVGALKFRVQVSGLRVEG